MKPGDIVVVNYNLKGDPWEGPYLYVGSIKDWHIVTASNYDVSPMDMTFIAYPHCKLWCPEPGTRVKCWNLGDITPYYNVSEQGIFIGMHDEKFVVALHESVGYLGFDYIQIMDL